MSYLTRPLLLGKITMNFKPWYAGIAFMGALTSLSTPVQAMDRGEALESTAKQKTGAQNVPTRNITGFSSALRCMDNKLITFSVPETWVVVEEILDQTKKVNAGAKDMFLTAVSEMTRRSRSIKLIAYGNDSGNTYSLMQNSERKVRVTADYGVRGSITQLDENVIKKQSEAGFTLPFLSASRAGTASTSVLGLDLNIINAKDFTIIPGVSSKNSTVIYKEGSGSDGEGSIRKLGLNFSFSLSNSDGQSQALRNLVELAAIELTGRLEKLPYWQCLGIDENTEEVKAEVSDWWEELSADQPRLVTYLQRQLKARGLYTGELDGQPDDELLNGLMIYRKALGLPESTKLDFPFFNAYLNGNHAELQPKARQEFAKYIANRPKPPEPPALSPDGIANVNLELVGTQPVQGGQNYAMTVNVDRPGYLYCYLQDESDKISRVFPNHYQANNQIAPGTKIELPGKMPFSFVANSKKVAETMACFSTSSDIAAKLLPDAWGSDLEPLNIGSFDALSSAFATASDGKVGLGVVYVKVK